MILRPNQFFQIYKVLRGYGLVSGLDLSLLYINCLLSSFSVFPVGTLSLLECIPHLPNVQRLQSRVFLQDKELVPHPASLYSLEQLSTTAINLRRATQKAGGMEQQCQKGESYGEQGVDPSLRM